MKKRLQNILLLHVALLYCFAVSIYSVNPFSIDAPLSTQSQATGKQYSRVVSSANFYHTVQTENSTAGLIHLHFSYLKNPFNLFADCFKAKARLSSLTFLQYNFYSRHLIVRLEKPDIVFPFHTFW